MAKVDTTLLPRMHNRTTIVQAPEVLEVQDRRGTDRDRDRDREIVVKKRAMKLRRKLVQLSLEVL